MKPVILSVFVAYSLLLSSCVLNLRNDEKSSENTDFEQITVNAEYSIGIPLYMTKTTALNDDASLQFQNIFKEAYVIVIDEDKDEFIQAYTELETYDTARSIIDNYSDIQMQLTVSRLDVISKDDVALTKINGLDAAMAGIDARHEGISQPISYFLTFIEGGEKLYMIMAWTLLDNKETHRATFEEIARSFKTLKRMPV